MRSDRPSQADSNGPLRDDIFATVREIADPAQRAVYLAKACGNDISLRLAVERMLELSAQAENKLWEEALGRARGQDFSVTQLKNITREFVQADKARTLHSNAPV